MPGGRPSKRRRVEVSNAYKIAAVQAANDPCALCSRSLMGTSDTARTPCGHDFCESCLTRHFIATLPDVCRCPLSGCEQLCTSYSRVSFRPDGPRRDLEQVPLGSELEQRLVRMPQSLQRRAAPETVHSSSAPPDQPVRRHHRLGLAFSSDKGLETLSLVEGEPPSAAGATALAKLGALLHLHVVAPEAAASAEASAGAEELASLRPETEAALLKCAASDRRPLSQLMTALYTGDAELQPIRSPTDPRRQRRRVLQPAFAAEAARRMAGSSHARSSSYVGFGAPYLTVRLCSNAIPRGLQELLQCCLPLTAETAIYRMTAAGVNGNVAHVAEGLAHSQGPVTIYFDNIGWKVRGQSIGYHQMTHGGALPPHSDWGAGAVANGEDDQGSDLDPSLQYHPTADNMGALLGAERASAAAVVRMHNAGELDFDGDDPIDLHPNEPSPALRCALGLERRPVEFYLDGEAGFSGRAGRPARSAGHEASYYSDKVILDTIDDDPAKKEVLLGLYATSRRVAQKRGDDDAFLACDGVPAGLLAHELEVARHSAARAALAAATAAHAAASVAAQATGAAAMFARTWWVCGTRTWTCKDCAFRNVWSAPECISCAGEGCGSSGCGGAGSGGDEGAQDAGTDQSHLLVGGQMVRVWLFIGRFHCLLNAYGQRSKLFGRAHLERYVQLWRRGSMAEKSCALHWIMFPPDPREAMVEFTFYALAHRASALQHLLRAWRAPMAPVTSADVEKHMHARACQFDAVAVLFCELRMLQAICLLQRAQRRGGYEDEAAAVRFLHLLAAVTGAATYMHLYAYDTEQWARMSPSMRRYFKTRRTVATRGGSEVYLDLGCELDVEQLRKWLGRYESGGDHARRVQTVAQSLGTLGQAKEDRWRSVQPATAQTKRYAFLNNKVTVILFIIVIILVLVLVIVLVLTLTLILIRILVLVRCSQRLCVWRTIRMRGALTITFCAKVKRQKTGR